MAAVPHPAAAPAPPRPAPSATERRQRRPRVRGPAGRTAGGPRAAHAPLRFPSTALCGEAPGAFTNLGFGSRCRPSRVGARCGAADSRRSGGYVLPRRQTTPTAAQHRRCAAKWRRPRASAPPRAAIGGGGGHAPPRGIQVRAGGGAAAPQLGAMLGRQQRVNNRVSGGPAPGKLCRGVKYNHRGSFTHPVHNTLKAVLLLCAGKGLHAHQAFLGPDEQRMRGGKYVRSSFSA